MLEREPAFADGYPLCDCGRPISLVGRDRAYVKYGSGEAGSAATAA